ncbi:MAG: efflux RND transporter permease subunit [Firmicutes bacterium]|nr:efflux RND transporter permease subunit [Bacillota bacterium]
MSRFSVKKPLTVFVVVIVIIALGIVSVMGMTPDLLPSIDLPYVVVMTTYPGATPEEVESEVTKPLEQSLATVESLESIQSVSNSNYSLVVMEFDNGSGMDTAVVNILQQVDLVEGSWSDSVGAPYIMKINPNMMPIAVASVDMDGYDTEKLSSFVEDTLMNKLEGITGVASINTGGLLESKVNIQINEEKIEELNEKLLKAASPSMARAKNQLNAGLKEIKKAESQLAASEKELENTKNDTYDQLAEASAQLDVAVSKASALATQIKVLEGRQAAIEAQISQGIYGPQVGITLEELQSQLKDVKSQLAVMQMDSAAAEAQVSQLQEAYKQAERGTYTAKETFDDAQAQLTAAKKQLSSQKSQLNSALAQLNTAGNQSLEAAGLDSMITIDMVSGILQGQNFSMPAGYIQEEEVKYLVSVGDELKNLDEVEGLFLFDIDGLGKVTLNDVADVFMSDNSDSIYASINGNPGVLLTFSRQSNYATATVSDNIEEKFRELSEEYEGLHFTTLMDQGDYIYLIISSIMQSLGWGALFAVIILLIFLRDIKPTFITLLSIPISITFAIVLMYFSGVTLNMISLSGLAVAVGMLVDNSIVVIENIFRMRRLGVPPKKAAIAGAKEVAAAITASTLTTVCVFAPIVFVDGITKQLFTDMALTVTYSLAASLIIALTLVPAMSSMMLVKEPKEEGKGFTKFRNGYRKLLNWNLNHKALILILAVALLVGSVYASLAKGFIFIPDMATPQLSGTIVMNDEEATLEETKEMADKAISIIRETEGVETVGGMLSQTGAMGGITGETSATSVSLYILVDEESDLSGGQIADNIEKACEGLDCQMQIMSSSSISSYTTALGGSGVSIDIYSTDNDKLQDAAMKLGEKLKTVEGVEEVDNGLTAAEPELHFSVDKESAMKNGLTVAQVYMQVAKALSLENTATSINLGGDEYDIVVSGGEESLSKEDIKNLELEGTDGDGDAVFVKLKDIAEIKATQTLPSIRRNDQRTYLTVSASVKEGYNITLVTDAAKEALEDFDLPEGVSYEFNGENETIMEAMYDLLKMMALGFLLVYLIMVAQFQSLKSPFIVMFTIPLAFTGGLLALLIFGKELSIIAMIGLILLMGVIVNNGIVLVDYTNQLRGRGLTKRQAIIEAGATRMRPVMMTSLTTILGLIVMAIGKTAGTDMMQPIALVCIGGLLYATVLTLLVVPVIYDVFNGEEYKAAKKEDLDISDLIVPFDFR